MKRRNLVVLSALSLVLHIGCANDPATDEPPPVAVPPMAGDAAAPTPPGTAHVASGPLTEEAYREGRPQALMDLLYEHRQTEIPPPGAPITELDLTDLMLDHEVVEAVGTLPDLTTLLLGGTNVDDEMIAGMGNPTRLSAIGLRRTLVTDASLGEMQEWPGLMKLYLSDTSVSDAGIDGIARLTGLTQLALSRTRVTADGLAGLAPLAALERLWIKGLALDDAAISALVARHPLLEVLSIADTGVGDAAVVELAGLGQLASLDLEGTPVTDGCLPTLIGMTNLRQVNLRGTGVTGHGVERLRHDRSDLLVAADHAAGASAEGSPDTLARQQNR